MSSWNDFRNALISVQDILDNEDATQGEVDNGYISLQNAISRLTSSSSGGNLLGGGHSSGGSHSSGGGSLKSESISEIKNFSYINITLTINDKVIHSKEYKDKKEGDTEVLNLINGFRQALNIEKEFSLSDFRRFNSDNLDALVLDIKNTVNNCIYLYCNGINEIDKIGIEKVFEGKAKYIYCIDKTTNKLVENNIIEKDAKSEISIKKDSGYIISDKPMDSLKDNSWNKCDNSWMYVKDGHVMTGWMKDTSNKWYYSKANGIMQTGWLKDTNGSWYHLGNDGAMNTGWIQDNSGKWYHLNSSGVMDTGWFKDIDSNWYQLGNDGAMKTGWFNDINGKWYYLKTSGAMAFNTIIDGYELGNDGALI